MSATPVDLRSDTVTRPSPEMRRAMADAEVGDDVYGEDPTVIRLQETVARMLGKEAALFFPSGVMANQASIRVLTHHGEVVLASENAHIIRYESGAAAAISGVQVKTIGADGLFTAEQVAEALPPGDHHFPQVSLVAIENTHNSSGGRVFPLEEIRRIAAVAHERKLRLHLDGARLFNSVAATGIPAPEWTAPFDTVSVCLSKGLGAPVGSLVAADIATVDRLHRVRKMLGGGMRQVGILAAAGIVALERNVERLVEDHANARRLAAGLAEAGFEIPHAPETNILVFHAPGADTFAPRAKEAGVLLNRLGGDLFRAVTHLDVSAAEIEQAITRLARLA